MADRYRQPAAIMSDSSGAASFTFATPPPGQVITGSIGIPAAPTTTLATVTIGGISWGSWQGNATFGPIQQWSGESVTIAVTGLAANTTYTAVLVGMAQDEQAAQIVWPNALATAVASSAVPAAVNSATAQQASTGTTTSITYTATLTGGGTNPVATLTVNTSVLVIITAAFGSLGGNQQLTSFAASGANIIAGNDDASISFAGPAGNPVPLYMFSAAFPLVGLSPGVTAFEMRYRVITGTSTNSWKDRSITVLALD